MPAPDPPPVDASPASAPARMDRLDRSLMVGMAALVVVSAVAAYVGGRYYRYYRDDLLLLPVVSFWVVGLPMAPMCALGGCRPQYRGRRLQALGLRGLVIALVLGGWTIRSGFTRSAGLRC